MIVKIIWTSNVDGSIATPQSFGSIGGIWAFTLDTIRGGAGGYRLINTLPGFQDYDREHFFAPDEIDEALGKAQTYAVRFVTLFAPLVLSHPAARHIPKANSFAIEDAYCPGNCSSYGGANAHETIHVVRNTDTGWIVARDNALLLTSDTHDWAEPASGDQLDDRFLWSQTDALDIAETFGCG